MKLILLVSLCMLVFILGIGIGKTYFQDSSFVNPLEKVVDNVIERPLKKYSFENLRKSAFESSVVSLGDPLKVEEDFASYTFYFLVDGKKVSGLLNMPKKSGTYPVIVLFRGFVEKDTFTTGEGTRRSAEYFAQNGFVTLAPDFLGYGESEKGSESNMEDRFQTYTTALTLLASMKNINTALAATESGTIQADPEKVGIWGHSNGGHIALAVLSITKKSYPAVLWNPVSKPFPYSILYFTDEYEDHGKGIRKLVADFEKDYDIEKYSPTNYYKYIDSSIQIHQALDDEAVPAKWSNQLYDQLTALDKDVVYFTYSGENHNFNRGSWPQAVQRSIDFFKEQLSK